MGPGAGCLPPPAQGHRGGTGWKAGDAADPRRRACPHARRGADQACTDKPAGRLSKRRSTGRQFPRPAGHARGPASCRSAGRIKQPNAPALLQTRRSDLGNLRDQPRMQRERGSRSESATGPTRGWVPAPNHVPLTALLITNGDTGLCIRMRWRNSLTSAESDVSQRCVRADRPIRSAWRKSGRRSVCRP